MTGMRRSLVALVPVMGAVVLSRTPYVGPLLYGMRRWIAALNPLAPTEDDAVG